MPPEIRSPNVAELAAKQTAFIEAVEGIGDILVFDAKRRNQNKEVLENLQRLADILKDLFNLRDKNPAKFDRMMLAQKFFKLYQENESEAKLRMSIDPGEYLIAFSTALNQIMRVHETALEIKNDEVSRYATYNLIKILADLSQQSVNGMFIEQLLGQLSAAMRATVAKSDRSVYAASIHWYIDIVFNKLGQREGQFRFEYREVFDRYFFSSVQYIVSEGQTALFQSLVSSLVDGVQFADYDVGKVWEYGHLILYSDLSRYQELNKTSQIEQRISELAASEKDIDSEESLNAWLKRFQELKCILKPLFNAQQSAKADEIENRIVDCVTDRFKHTNLLEIIFAIGAYCIAKNKPEYVRYLWEYKQPPDSEITWIGHNIVPNTLEEVLNLYFRESLHRRNFSFLEGHRDAGAYFRKYVVMLLARIIQGEAPGEGKDATYISRSSDVLRLSNIKDSISSLVKVAEELGAQEELLSSLGFDRKSVRELFKEQLPLRLNTLASKAEERIVVVQKEQPISDVKIKEFKSELFKEYDRLATIRNVFQYINSFKDRTNEKYTGQIHRYGLNQAEAKAAFFEKWHVHFVGWGTRHGEGIALEENSKLTREISEKCIRVGSDQFLSTLDAFEKPTDILMLATPLAKIRLIESLEGFKPKWSEKNPLSHMNGYAGSFLVRNQSVPVIEYFNRDANNRVLILSKSRLGEMIQWSPLDEGESEGLRSHHFLVNIRAFSHETSLMEQYLKVQPPWLETIKGEERRKDYLRERVLVQILERFEFVPHKDFYGYVFDVSEQ